MPEGPPYQPAPFPEPQPWGTDTVVVGGRAARRRGRRSRFRRRLLASMAALLTLGLVGAGSLYAVDLLSGGGLQPEEVIPADAFAFAKVDLDPSAEQKIDAIRYFRHFPGPKGSLSRDNDLRKAIFDGYVAVEDDLDAVDYDRDVEPWLGQRLGLALLPSAKGGGEPRVVLALQVTDEGLARKSLPKITNAMDAGGGFVVVGDYALLAEDEKTARQAADSASRKSLADSPGYVADIESLGERGVAVAWADMDRGREHLVDAVLAEAPPQTSREDLRSMTDLLDERGKAGRVAFTARFEPRYAEVVGRTIGAQPPTADSKQRNRIGDLPESTGAALSVTNSGDLVREGWKSFESTVESEQGEELRSALDRLRDTYGIVLPDDLAVLLGQQTAVTLEGADTPRLGFVAVTDGDKAEAVLDKLEAVFRDARGEPLPIDPARHGDSMILATDDSYEQELAPGGRSLAADSDFRTALPEAADADVALWVDVEQLMKTWGRDVDDKSVRDTLNAIGAVGLTTVTKPDGGSTFRMRMVAD